MTTYLPYIIGGIIAILVIILFATGYVKAPPDQAYIISGFKKKGRTLIGRAGVKIPFLERLDKLYLGQMTVDIKTEQSVPTNDFINVNVDAVAKVRILPTAEGISLAAKNFLNKSPEGITLDLQDSLQGNMREIIGTLSLKSINTDRDSFSDQVMQKASKDMERLGIEILSCNIQNVTDDNGLIRDLGADNTARIKKDAAIAKAQADRDVEIAQAEAAKASNDAKVKAAEEMAERNNALAIKQANLQKEADTEKARAEAAKSIEAENQRKLKDVAETNANIAKAEREAELKQKEIELKEYELDALVRKQADAEKYKAEKEAEAKLAARQREAEAEKYEREQEAEAALLVAQKEAEARKAAADAERYAAEAEAAAIKAKGDAEAAAIKAKGEAEAAGIEKKAEAQAKMKDASIVEMLMKALPEMTAAASAPLANVDSITMYGEGNQAKMVGDITTTVSKVINGVKDATGIDLASMLAGYLGGKAATPPTSE